MELPTMRLRNWRADVTDENFLIANMNDPTIYERLPVPHPYTKWNARAWVPTSQWNTRNSHAVEFPTFVNSVERYTTWRTIGQVSVRPFDGNFEVGLLGFWIASWERGKGRAHHAARLAVEDAFLNHNFKRVQAYMDVANIASQKVVEKAGFVREGVLRSWYELKGERRDFYMYSILPRDVF